MNRRETIVMPSRLNPCDVVSGSSLGDYSFAYALCGTESADPTTFGQGRCR
jgi:hypothetical protein